MSERDFKFDHLVYLRIFEGCNLACDHCFIPANPKKMSQETIKNIVPILKMQNKIKENQLVLLQWHGGEPTIFGVDYLKKAIEIVEASNQENIQDSEQKKYFNLAHGIQTNLLNYHENRTLWVNLYKEKFNGEVGVSYDPLIRKIKTGNPETANARFEELFWKNLSYLIEDGISPYMVITATKTLFESIKDPTLLFDKLADIGVKKLHLERVTKTGEARENWNTLGLNNLEYVKYMSRWFKTYALWKKNRVQQQLSVIHLSPYNGFEDSVQKLLNNTANIGYGCWSGSCDSNFHTIDANGYKKGCTALTSEVDNKSSKVSQVKWFKKDVQNNQPNYLQELRQNRQEDCQTCEFLTICSSGCLSVDKFDGSGECSGGKGLFKTTKLLVESGISNF